jgi:phospholipase C
MQMLGSGAMASARSSRVTKALPAGNRTATINDVEHIVILTQENRPFDHHFGARRRVSRRSASIRKRSARGSAASASAKHATQPLRLGMGRKAGSSGTHPPGT